MLIRDISKCKEIKAVDDADLTELLNPLNDPVNTRYSLAAARVQPGKTTILHRLKSSEVYYIIRGEGEMFIGDERGKVHAGQAIYIPSDALQRIANTGKEELVFICIVDPAWRKEDEEVIESPAKDR